MRAGLKTIIKIFLLHWKILRDYAARAEIMWVGSVAHNDLFGTDVKMTGLPTALNMKFQLSMMLRMVPA